MKCCKENHQAMSVRVFWFLFFVCLGFFSVLTWTCGTVSHHTTADLWAARGWTWWFNRQISWCLMYLIFWVSNVDGNTKTAEFESEFYLQNETCMLFSEELVMNSPPRLKFAWKFKFINPSIQTYFPLIPEVLLLAVFGKIITLLSLEHNDSLILSPEAVAACWAFLLLLLVNALEEAALSPVKRRIFWQEQKRPSQSPLSPLTVSYLLSAS